jgi:hypothetical protein
MCFMQQTHFCSAVQGVGHNDPALAPRPSMIYCAFSVALVN